MKKIICMFIVFTNISFGFITVGTDENCDFNTNVINSSLFSNGEIRITNTQVYEPIRIINNSANIVGGFDSCDDAENNIVSKTASSVSGNDSNTPLVIITTASGGHLLRTSVLKNLVLIEGKNVVSPPDFTIGGGVHIVGNVNVTLVNLEIHNNISTAGGAGLYINGLNGAVVNIHESRIHDNNTSLDGLGGGLWINDGAQVNIVDSVIDGNSARLGAGIVVETGNSTLNLSNTRISNNTASQNGGGVYCIGTNAINISGSSSVNDNSANLGGGLYLTSNCRATSKSGDNLNLNAIEYGINNNTATIFGGGVYINSGARFNLIGNNLHYANLTNNQTFSNTSRGGGVYAIGINSYFVGINARISGNRASTGSALYTRENAVAHMRRSSGECFGNQICSEISNNASELFGTIATESCGRVEINQSAIYDNVAASSVVALLEGNNNDNCASVFEGNVIYNNHRPSNVATNLIGLDRKYELEFAFNTVVDNNSSVIFSMFDSLNSIQTLRLNTSLIWNAPANTIGGNLAIHNFSGNCLGVTDFDSLPDGFGNYIQQNIPIFSDSENRDYSRTINSPYSDDCNTEQYAPRFHDIIGTVRGHAWISPVLGPYDIGAYEYDDVNFNNVIFQDGF